MSLWFSKSVSFGKAVCIALSLGLKLQMLRGSDGGFDEQGFFCSTLEVQKVEVVAPKHFGDKLSLLNFIDFDVQNSKLAALLEI